MKLNKKLLAIAAIFVIAIISGLWADDSDMFISIAAFNFTPILRKPGAISMPGMKNWVCFIPEQYVKVAPATTAASPCIAAGEFTFTEGGKFKFIQCTNKSVSHDFETQGVTGSKSFKQKGEFFVPGSNEEIDNFTMEVINTAGYLLMCDAEGNQILVGMMDDTVELTAAGGLGKAATDSKGSTFSWEWDSSAPKITLAEPIDVAALKAASVVYSEKSAA